MDTVLLPTPITMENALVDTALFYIQAKLHFDYIPNQIAYLALDITVSSVFGARLFSLIFEDGIKVFSNPLKSIFRPGFWLHGGVTFLIMSLYRNQSVMTNRLVFIDAAGLGFPLYEFFSRLGCHSYGCCFGKKADKKSKALFSPII